MSTPHLNKQQVILRNASTDLDTARLMLNLACTSRRSTGKLSLRSYSVGLFAIIYAILFLTAGIFSNKAISAGSTSGSSAVLLRSKHCGIRNETYREIVEDGNYSTEEEFGLYVQYVAKEAHDVQLSLEYAHECYLSQLSTNYVSSTCNTLKTSNLSWESREGSCPFESQMCHNKSKTIVLDTGDIDSHDDLGINAKPNDRLRYRRITTCAVLDGAGHVRGWDGAVVNSSSPKSSLETAYAYYSPSLYKNTDWTYSYSNFASFYDNFTAQVTMPYQLDVEQVWGPADPAWSLSDFDPIPELTQKEADLTLFFLSFTGMYLGQVDDPWFSAHNEEWFNNRLPFLQKRYTRDMAISTLGCTEQHKFCTSNDTCTEFLGFDQVQNVDSFNAALTPHQNATFDRILRAVAASYIKHVVENLFMVTTPVLASNVTTSGSSGVIISSALPEYQWKLEVNYWHSIAMAQLQRTVAQWATGQIAPEPQHVQYLLPPTEEQDTWFCKNLIIPSIVYQSFSMVAITSIVTFGTLVIIASLNIEKLACLIRKCFGKSTPWKTWDHDDMLELQRSMDENIWRPQTLPKDDGCRSASRRRGPSKSLKLRTIALGTK